MSCRRVIDRRVPGADSTRKTRRKVESDGFYSFVVVAGSRVACGVAKNPSYMFLVARAIPSD